jgi:putative transcriptional regulator
MIKVHLDLLLAKRKLRSKELAARIGLSENNLSRIKTGNIKAIRWSTLEALCRELNCQPGDLLEYEPDEQ